MELAGAFERGLRYKPLRLNGRELAIVLLLDSSVDCVAMRVQISVDDKPGRLEGVPMKNILSVLALAVALVAVPRIPTYADASQQGCESSGGRAAGCSNAPVNVPEPGTSALLAFGLAAVGGLALVLGMKRLSRN